MGAKCRAEFIGTFWLVLGGCGTAIFAGSQVGNLGVALAFGLTVLTMAYAVGHISGGHFNPAVSVGLAVAGRFDKKLVIPYIVYQCFGAIAAATILYVIVRHGPNPFIGRFAANGFGDYSPMGYSAAAAFVAELTLTAMFLFVILGVTDKRAPAGFAPIAIGLCLTLIHLISIPITNTSVNPARSLSQALFVLLFVDGWAWAQLWLFCLAPIAGGALGAMAYRALVAAPDDK